MPARKNHSYLTFTVADQYFALPLAIVEGAVPLPDIIVVPGNRSRFFQGLSYVLGQIVSVIDLRPLANLRPASKNDDAIVIRVGGYYYAVRVSALGGIINRPKVKARPKRIGNLSGPWFEHHGDKVVILDNLETLIATEVCK